MFAAFLSSECLVEGNWVRHFENYVQCHGLDMILAFCQVICWKIVHPVPQNGSTDSFMGEVGKYTMISKGVRVKLGSSSGVRVKLGSSSGVRVKLGSRSGKTM